MTHGQPRAAIVGVYNTPQARRLEGYTPATLAAEAVHGVLDDAGLTLADIDGVSAVHEGSSLVYDYSFGPAWIGGQFGLGMLPEAVAAIEHGQATAVLIVAAEVGAYVDHASTAPWTRPENEWVAPWGLFTAAEFALIAQRHMSAYGTTREQLSIVAATIRNNGAVNPDAVYYGRGPFKPADIVASRPIAEPFHLLDCSMTSEGGCALIIARDDIARTARRKPVYVLGAGADYFGPAYHYPPSFDLRGRRGEIVNGRVGAQAADNAFRSAGLTRDDVDVLELYDPFSFEIIRQLEAFGFCDPGEGGPFVEDGNIDPTGKLPLNTDGGLMSYSHAGANPQMLQRVIRGAQQIRRDATSLQVPDAHVALCSGGGAGALFNSVVILGDERP